MELSTTPGERLNRNAKEKFGTPELSLASQSRPGGIAGGREPTQAGLVPGLAGGRVLSCTGIDWGPFSIIL